MAALKRAGIRAVPTGLEHGTVTAVLAGRGLGRGSGPGSGPVAKRAVDHHAAARRGDRRAARHRRLHR